MSVPGRLTGKVVLISGAARGQGEAAARLCAREGASVVLGDILTDLGKAVAEDIGRQAHPLRLASAGSVLVVSPYERRRGSDSCTTVDGLSASRQRG